MKKRERAFVFTDAEKDEFFEAALKGVSCDEIMYMDISIELKRKIFLEKAKQSGSMYEVGLSCRNTDDVRWFLQHCDDQKTLQEVARYFNDRSEFFSLILEKLEKYTWSQSDANDLSLRNFIFHPKMQIPGGQWEIILTPRRLKWSKVTLDEIFRKIDFSSQDLNLGQRRGIAEAFRNTPEFDIVRIILSLHYPAIPLTRHFVENGQVSRDFLRSYFKYFPTALQKEIMTLKLVCQRARRYIAKDVEDLIARTLVASRVIKKI